VVHHRNFPEVLATVAALLDAGLAPESLVLVDNSDDPEIEAQLRSSLPTGVVLRCVPNHGYGHAVNLGAAVLAQRRTNVVVVATHEVQPEAAAVEQLVEAVLADRTVGVAGPTLLLPGRTEVWSTGGSLSRVLGWPGHVQRIDAPGVVDRDWLDGSLCAYRAEALAERLREDFFLYVEEMEFHRRLREKGWRVMWVPAARAVQDTLGTPPFLQARNLQLYFDTWGSPVQRLVSVPALIVRQALVRLARRRRPVAATRAAICGWRAGRSVRSVGDRGPVGLPSSVVRRY
jgi:GT2 family glycosyltransferase